MDAERIPDDIAATAKRIAGMDWYEGDVFGEIASAILAERMRCLVDIEWSNSLGIVTPSPAISE